jgi:hypothetical protein
MTTVKPTIFSTPRAIVRCAGCACACGKAQRAYDCEVLPNGDIRITCDGCYQVLWDIERR